jgi:hypothetical protein
MKKKEPKNSLVVLILCLLIVTITFLLINNRKDVFVTNAINLINAYENDKTKADKIYKNKICVLSGTIFAMIDKNGKFVDILNSEADCNGIIFLKENNTKVLGESANFAKVGIFCYFKKENKRSFIYKVGSKITLRGKITGILSKPCIFGYFPTDSEEEYFIVRRAEDLILHAITVENCKLLKTME